MARYSVVHTTHQRYRENVHRSRNEVRLQPVESGWQHLVKLDVSVTPTGEMSSSLDYYGNSVYLIAVESPHRDLVVEVRSEVDVQPPHFDPVVDYPWDDDSLAFDPAAEFLAPSPRVPRLRQTEKLMDEFGIKFRDPDSLMTFNSAIREAFKYVPGATTVGTRLPEVLERRVGVCQDFAHVMLAAARQAGWPARYVSGYLLPNDDEAVGESHAWVEVATPDGRWTGLDPTHGTVVTDGHIRVAVGRDYDDVPPVRGTFTGQLPGEPPDVKVRIKELPIGADELANYVFADQ